MGQGTYRERAAGSRGSEVISPKLETVENVEVAWGSSIFAKFSAFRGMDMDRREAWPEVRSIPRG